MTPAMTATSLMEMTDETDDYEDAGDEEDVEMTLGLRVCRPAADVGVHGDNDKTDNGGNNDDEMRFGPRRLASSQTGGDANMAMMMTQPTTLEQTICRHSAPSPRVPPGS